MAEKLGVDERWLLAGRGDMQARQVPSESDLLEVIAWQANRIRELEAELSQPSATKNP